MMTLPIFGQNAKLATLSTCHDIILGLIAVLGVIDPGSGYTVALGKLLRGGLGSRVERNTVRKVDQNGRNGQRRDSNTRRPWPRRAMVGWLQPTKTTLTTSVPSMGLIDGDFCDKSSINGPKKHFLTIRGLQVTTNVKSYQKKALPSIPPTH